MNTTTSHLTDSIATASSPASSLPAHASASAETPTPTWTEAYFTELDRSCNTAAAALAAAATLPAIIRLRQADPAFAARESAVLQAIPELLLGEALRRTLARAKATETCSQEPASPSSSAARRSPAQPRFGSDALLVKLLRHYLPGFGGSPKAPRSPKRSPHPEPASGDPTPSQTSHAATPAPSASSQSPASDPPPVTSPEPDPAAPEYDLPKYFADRHVLLDQIGRLQAASYPADHPKLLQARTRLDELRAGMESARAKRDAQQEALDKASRHHRSGTEGPSLRR